MFCPWCSGPPQARVRGSTSLALLEVAGVVRPVRTDALVAWMSEEGFPSAMEEAAAGGAAQAQVPGGTALGLSLTVERTWRRSSQGC